MQTAAGTSTTWSSFSRQPASWLPLRQALADRFPAHIDGARFAPFVHKSSTDREAQYALTDACGSSTASASGSTHRQLRFAEGVAQRLGVWSSRLVRDPGP